MSDESTDSDDGERQKEPTSDVERERLLNRALHVNDSNLAEDEQNRDDLD